MLVGEVLLGAMLDAQREHALANKWSILFPEQLRPIRVRSTIEPLQSNFGAPPRRMHFWVQRARNTTLEGVVLLGAMLDAQREHVPANALSSEP